MLLASCSGKSKMLLTVKLILPDVAMVGCAHPSKKISPQTEPLSLKAARK